MSEPTRPQTDVDMVDPWRVAALAATTGSGKRGNDLHPLGHWTMFRPQAETQSLNLDGHMQLPADQAHLGGLRRMWAGGALSYLRPIRIGDSVERSSRILSIEEKHGRSGTLHLVSQEHVLSVKGEEVLRETRDIVYRAPALFAKSAGETSQPGQWQRRLTPSPVLLMRYSALTFNAHRIHYDLPYTRDVEGYPGLVVHGPLVATLLMDLLREAVPNAPIRKMRYRALRPLFSERQILLNGRPTEEGAELWAEDDEGFVAMRANVILGETE